jgi:hypothetical protein
MDVKNKQECSEWFLPYQFIELSLIRQMIVELPKCRAGRYVNTVPWTCVKSSAPQSSGNWSRTVFFPSKDMKDWIRAYQFPWINKQMQDYSNWRIRLFKRSRYSGNVGLFKGQASRRCRVFSRDSGTDCCWKVWIKLILYWSIVWSYRGIFYVHQDAWLRS